jgi:hypothetical protein
LDLLLLVDTRPRLLRGAGLRPSRLILDEGGVPDMDRSLRRFGGGDLEPRCLRGGDLEREPLSLDPRGL